MLALFIVIEKYFGKTKAIDMNLMDDFKHGFSWDHIVSREIELRKCFNNAKNLIFPIVVFNFISSLLCRSMVAAFNEKKLQASAIELTNKVLCAVMELQKSVLIDIELAKYSPTLIVAGIFSAVIEIKLHELFERAGSDGSSEQAPPSTKLFKLICQLWERIIVDLFGTEAIPHVDSFGRYIFLRQKRIYRVFINVNGRIS